MNTVTIEEQTKRILHELGFPLYKSGYRRLCIGLPYFVEDPEQSLAKELYPRNAEETGCTVLSVEASIRRAIQAAWELGDQAAWQKYFPGITKAPSNQVFIGTIAEYLK